MRFFEYLKDKLYFLLFYLLTMSFVTLIMYVSNTEQNMFNNIWYTNVSCLLLLILYILIGYYYRRKFYQELIELIESGHEEIIALLPETQSYQQKLFLSLFKKIIEVNTQQYSRLTDEKRDQQEFIMAWIHEVKLPIAGSRLLMENSKGKSTDWLIDKLEDELDKIDDYVEQALYYSRIDSFAKDYFITEVSVNKVIKNSVKKYAKLFINKRIGFTMDEEELWVQSDSKWLGFVIDQIIANALKYTHEDGKVSIQFEEGPKEKALIIGDNGIGIKLEDLNRVFEKGFTGSIGRSHAKSTGMGLYLAKQLASKLGHEISIKSQEGQFTKVTIHFPKIRNYYQFN
jgi:signal transduction histidine kinase